MATVYDKSSLFLAPSGVSNGTVFVQKPVPEYGSEILSQPVDIDTDFRANAGGVIVDANTFTTAGGSSDGIISSILAIQAGKQYRLEIQGTTTSNGFTLGNGGTGSGNEYGTGFGVHYFTAAHQTLWFRQGTAGTTDITTFSIKEVLVNGDFTFTRGSNLSATRVNEAQLIEKGRENLLLQSNQFDTTWGTSNASVTSGQSGHAGSSNAWLLNSTGAYGSITQSFTAINGVSTLSIYAKAGTNNWLLLRMNATSDPLAWFDLENGVLGSTTGPTIESKIEAAGTDGWYRCSITGSTSLFSQVLIFPANANLVVGAAGNIYIQDAQLEQGLVATGYIETTTAAVQKGILENLPRLDYSGGASCPALLLEPQRTNAITQSEYFGDSFWTKFNTSVSSGFTSPDGLTNAYKLIASVSNTNHRIRSSVMTTPAVGTAVTFSIYCKPQEITKIALVDNWTNVTYSVVNLSTNSVIEEGFYSGTGSTSITEMANGFKRISFTYQSSNISTFPAVYLLDDGYTSGNPTSYAFSSDGTSGVLIYGAQFEVASYPTSYIPAYGSSVTRSGDTCSDAGDATTFNDSEGVLYAEIAALADDGTFRNISVNNGTTAQSVRIYYRNTANKITALIGSSSGGGVTVNVANLYTFNKIALVYQNDNAKLFVNGILEGTIQGITMPTGLNQLDFNIAGVLPFYGKAKEVIYFPTALTDDECIALTTI